MPPYNGSGTYTLTAGQPVVAGTDILDSTFNTLTADLATALSTCVTRDGQSPPTTNLPMGSFKLTGLAAGTAAGHSVRFEQLQTGVNKLITVAGTGDVITGVMTPTYLAYVAGDVFTFVVGSTNTTNVTINIDGLGAKAVTVNGSTALVAGALPSGKAVQIGYDGTRFQLLTNNYVGVATGTLPVANGGTGVTTSTGSGANVLGTSPTLVTPILGTPTSGVATNLTGLPLTTGVTGTLPEANGGTGTTVGYCGFKNRIINGGMSIWQRGTSAAGTAGYLTADRFALVGGGTVTNSKSATPNSPNGNYSYVWTTGAASSYVNVSQAIERDNVYALRGQTVSVNYWVMSTGTAYVGIQSVVIYYSNTTDAINYSGALSSITATNISPTSSWQQVKATFLIPTDAVGLTVQMNTSSAEPSGVVVSFADLQLEIGSTATSFDYRPYGTELALCQRYYQQLGNVAYVNVGTGFQQSTTIGTFYIKYNTTMRVSPTFSVNNLIVSDRFSFDLAVSANIQAQAGLDSAYINVTNAAGGASRYPVFLAPANATTGYLSITAEL